MCSQIRPLIRNELRVSDNFEVQGNSGVQGPGFGVQGLGVRVEGLVLIVRTNTSQKCAAVPRRDRI